MNHAIYGKKLSRSTDERKRLIKNLMKSLIQHGAIKTSKAKAQAVRGSVEKLITKAKKGTDVSKRQVIATLSDRKTAQQIIEMAQTRFTSRTSGYTRITRIGIRLGDATEQVILSFVDEKVTAEVVNVTKKSTTEKADTSTKNEVKKEKKAKTVKKDK